MTAIFNALSSGYAPKKILDFIKKLDPAMAAKVNMAMQAGHSIDKVLDFLYKGGNKINQALGESPKHQENNLYKTSRTKMHKAIPGMAKTALAVGAGIGVAGLARSMPASIQSMLPSSAVTPQPNIPISPEVVQKGNAFPVKTNIQTETPSMNQAIPKQPPVPDTPKGPTLTEIDVNALKKQKDFISKIQNMHETGNPTDAISGFFESLHPNEVKEVEKTTKRPFKEVVEAFTSQLPKEEKKASYMTKTPEDIQPKQPAAPIEEVQPQEQQLVAESASVQPAPVEPVPPVVKPPEVLTNIEDIAKGANKFDAAKRKINFNPTEKTAILPDGKMGEVQSVKNGIAKIDVDGQVRNRKEEDLIKSPLPQKDLADLYSDLINAIPEDKRSAVINFAGYDEANNELIFRPHGGAAYVYKDIPKEFADKLKNSMFKAKTSGENFYGSWETGEASRHAGLAALIKDLQKQYGGKGKEYTRKYLTLVDILEEPEKAKREKHRKQMEEKKKARNETPKTSKPPIKTKK